ncbi:MAG: DUF503 domain-containing protein [Phycisphaerales bacterium]
MVVGVLQFELLIPWAESLKDKRSVIRSVKDRLHRQHLVSVAEVSAQDVLNVARMGLAVVTTDGAHAASVLDRIEAKLRGMTDAELGETSREILVGRSGPLMVEPKPMDERALADELRNVISPEELARIEAELEAGGDAFA